MTKDQYRLKAARFILGKALAMVVFLIIFRMMSAFTNSELKEILSLLLPINALYITIVIKYAVNAKSEVETTNSSTSLSPIYLFTARSIAWAYVLTFFGSFLLFAFNSKIIPNIEVLKLVIMSAESFLGVYAGAILTDLYSLSNTKN